MVSLRHKSWFYRFIWEIGHSPLRLTELLQFLVLGWVLISALIGFGGFLPYGSPMVGVSKWIWVLAAVHALVIVFKEKRPQLILEALLPLPFLAYVWFNNQVLSPTPWIGTPVVTAWFQAYCVFLIVLNSIQSRRSRKWFIILIQIVIGVVLFGAFFQYYLFPEWMPSGERLRNPAYAHGAAGFLQDPVTLGGILLAGIPLSFLMMTKHYRTRPSWMFQGFFGLALVLGFVLCSHRPGLIVGFAVLLLLPLLMTARWSSRSKLWIYLVLILLVGGILTWLGTQDLRDRVLYYIQYSGDPLATESRSIALRQFLDHAIFGQGLGSFQDSWEKIGAGVKGSSLYVHSAFLGILAELGLFGILLAAIPVAVYFQRAFSVWRSLPHMFLNKEVEGRLRKLPRRHPSRRRLEKDLGRMPTQKVVSGALCLGLIAFLVYQAWDYAIQLPFVLILGAVMSAVLLSNGRLSQHHPAKGRWWIGTAILPVSIATACGWIGSSHYYSSYLTYTTSEHLATLQADPNKVFDDPAITSYLESRYELAIELVAGNADAWTGLGDARLARLYADLEPASEIAQRALPAYEQAVALFPASWMAEFGIARCKAMTGAKYPEVVTHLQRAVELAPLRPEPLSMLGNVLLLEDQKSGAGAEYLRRALELVPAYIPAVDAVEKLGLESSTMGAGRTALVDLGYIAEQHTLIPPLPNRVLGAGLIKIESPVHSFIEE